MKVLLISITVGALTEEVGIEMIASILKEKYEVKILSFNLKSAIEIIRKSIIEYMPEVVGINIYNATREKVYEVSQLIKNINTKITIFVGGVEAFCNPERILEEEKKIDFVVVGEGEETTLELLEAVENDLDLQNIKGIAYRNEKGVVTNQRRKLLNNISGLPMPDRSILKNSNIKIASISTSRGCTGNCSFCITPAMWKEQNVRWRGKTVDEVVEEIRQIADLGYLHLFVNDCSYEDPDISRMLTIARRLIDDQIKIYYSVDFKPSIYKKLSNDDVDLLKTSGLVNVFIGIESGNKDDLKLYNKGISVVDNQEVLRFFNKHNINQHFGFINFNPYSTFESLHENNVFLSDFQKYSLGNVFNYPTALMIFEKTALYEKIKAEKLFKNSKDTVFKYVFLDYRIQVLAEFMIKKFGLIQKEFGNIIMHDLADKYFDILEILLREFSLSDNYTDLVCAISENLSSTKELILNNFHQHEFFHDLLCLAENNWSETRANDIVDSVYNRDVWMSLIDRIKMERMSLYKRVITKDEHSRKLLCSLT